MFEFIFLSFLSMNFFLIIQMQIRLWPIYFRFLLQITMVFISKLLKAWTLNKQIIHIICVSCNTLVIHFLTSYFATPFKLIEISKKKKLTTKLYCKLNYLRMLGELYFLVLLFLGRWFRIIPQAIGTSVLEHYPLGIFQLHLVFLKSDMILIINNFRDFLYHTNFLYQLRPLFISNSK